MMVRNKNGTCGIDSGAGLLDFLRGELGMRLSEGGIKGIRDGLNVELICSVPFSLKVGSDGNGIPWTFSTFDLDRFSERIDPAGWDYKRYLDNPVVEWAHRYDIPAIGRADSLYTDEKGLHGLVIFNEKEYDPFGWSIGERIKRGVIRAGSVGFRILEIEIPDKEAVKDGTALIFRKQELLEFSICNVPANPWSLAKPFALMKSEGEPKVREPSVRLGMRSEETNPKFWGNFIGGIGE